MCPVNVGGGRRSGCGGGVSGGNCRMGEGGSTGLHKANLLLCKSSTSLFHSKENVGVTHE